MDFDLYLRLHRDKMDYIVGRCSLIQGWKTWFFFSSSQSEEWAKGQIIMMAWFFWIAFSIVFLIGLFNPEFRFYKLKNSL